MVDFPIIVRDQSAIFSAERNTRLAQFTWFPVSLPDRSTMVILDQTVAQLSQFRTYPIWSKSQIICYSSCLSVVINEEFNQLFFRIYLSRSDAGCHVGPSLAPPVLPRNSAISGRLYLPWSDNVAYFDKSESFSSANEYNYQTFGSWVPAQIALMWSLGVVLQLLCSVFIYLMILGNLDTKRYKYNAIL